MTIKTYLPLAMACVLGWCSGHLAQDVPAPQVAADKDEISVRSLSFKNADGKTIAVLRTQGSSLWVYQPHDTALSGGIEIKFADLTPSISLHTRALEDNPPFCTIDPYAVTMTHPRVLFRTSIKAGEISIAEKNKDGAYTKRLALEAERDLIGLYLYAPDKSEMTSLYIHDDQYHKKWLPKLRFYVKDPNKEPDRNPDLRAYLDWAKDGNPAFILVDTKGDAFVDLHKEKK